MAIAVASLLSAACASQQTPIMSTEGSTVIRTATVTNVRDVTVRGGRSSGLGTAVGAVLGSVAGSTIGGGNGSAVASVGGAVAGGMAGQHIAQSASSTSTEVTVRLDNGEVQTYRAEPGESYRVGDAVKLMTTNAGTRLSR